MQPDLLTQNKGGIMLRHPNRPYIIAFFAVVLLIALPAPGFSNEMLGGVTFLGEREGVCVLIEGECIEESIYFKLDTCDENRDVKEQFKDRTPFTLLVPKGEHRLVIMKEGEKVVSDTITITPEEVLEYRLP
jgi:hypothetical protein